MFKRSIKTMALSAVLLGTMAVPALALKILPPRVVMKPEENIAYVYVKNDSASPKSYSFGWRNFAMTKDGEVKRITGSNAGEVPDYRPVEQYIRYSPRRTTIQPGQTQRITLFAKRAPSMADGEYRSHFVVERLPDNRERKNQPGDSDGAKVGVNIMVSRSFPVYMLHGDVDAALSITGARFVSGKKMHKATGKVPLFVEVGFEKTGNRSVIGNINVLCGDEPIHVSHKVFSVYAEADRSKEQILVDQDKAKACSAPRVVVYGHADDLLAGQLLGEVIVSR